MKKEVLDYVIEKTHELMNAASCSSEAKAAAQSWLDAVGTEREADETKEYMPIDNLIAFAGSEAGAGYFGAELARNITAHAEEIKLAGAEYCDCPACAAVAEILARKKELL